MAQVEVVQQALPIFIPSQYQQAVFNFVENSRGDGIVNAVAGSGKTTTLVHAARLIKADRAIFCAFNKSIAESLSARLAGTTMQAKTIHSIGNGCLYRALGKTQIQDSKYNKLARAWCDKQRVFLSMAGVNHQEAVKSLTKLTNLARASLIPGTDKLALVQLALAHQIEGYEPVLAGVAAIMEEGVKQAEYGKVIDFTDMIWLPHKMDLYPPKVDWVFCDECQDLSPAQLDVVLRQRAPGGRMLFVGDPRQAIYAFAGADSNSFWTIKARTGAQEMPLSVNYRCPTSHLNMARQIVPQIEAREGAPVGIYQTIKEADLLKTAREGDLILCRTTAPLIHWCVKFIEQKISARVRGRDVGRDLTDMAKGIAANEILFDYKEFGTVLSNFEERQVMMLSQKEGNEGRIEALRDRIDALRICWQSFSSVTTLDDLCTQIEGLFSDDRPSIWLSTVHRAKGLEEQRVFILKPDKLPLIWKNQTAEQLEQEMNLKYVALTRSMAELYMVAGS